MSKPQFVLEEADKVIAELKRNVDNWTDSYEISRKINAELEAENRKLKRALWLARLRSLRDFSVLAYFQTIRAKGKESHMDFDEMAYRIDLARVKCRAKAEEYK